MLSFRTGRPYFVIWPIFVKIYDKYQWCDITGNSSSLGKYEAVLNKVTCAFSENISPYFMCCTFAFCVNFECRNASTRSAIYELFNRVEMTRNKFDSNKGIFHKENSQNTRNHCTCRQILLTDSENL